MHATILGADMQLWRQGQGLWVVMLSRLNPSAHAWFSAGLRIINIANPYRPEEDGYFIPSTPESQETIQTNDAFVDDRGLIYIIDRLGIGLDILEYTARNNFLKLSNADYIR